MSCAIQVKYLLSTLKVKIKNKKKIAETIYTEPSPITHDVRDIATVIRFKINF